MRNINIKKNGFFSNVCSNNLCYHHGYSNPHSKFVGLRFGALASVPFNIIQGAVGAFIAVVIINVLNKNKTLKDTFKF